MVYNKKDFYKKNDHRWNNTIQGWSIGILTGIIFLLLFEAFVYTKKSQLKAQQEKDAIKYSGELISSFNSELNKLIYLNSGIEAYIKAKEYNLERKELENIIKNLIQNENGIIRNIGIAEGYVIKYIEPVVGNEKALGIDYRDIPTQYKSVEKAISNRKGTMDGPLNLVQGGKGLIYRSPIFNNNEYWGLLSTVINFDSLCHKSFSNVLDKKFTFSISIKNTDYQENVFYGDYHNFNSSNSTIVTADVPNGLWYYSITPTNDSNYYKPIQYIIWIGRIFSILLIFITYLIFKQRQRNKESQEKYRLLSDYSSDVICVYNLNKNQFTYLSPSIYKFSGYTQEEGNNISFKVLIPKRFQIHILSSIKTQLKRFYITNDSEKHFLLQFQFIRKNGALAWVEYSAHFQFSFNNNIEMVGTARNIDHIKLIENQLINNKRIYKITHEIAKMGYWEMDLLSKEIQWSDELYQILDVRKKDVSPSVQNYFEFVHPDDQLNALKNHYQAIEHYEKFEIQYRIKLANGTIKHINEKCRIEKDTESNPKRAISIIQDITAKIKSETKLQQLSEAVEQSPVSIVITDVTGKISYANKFTAETTGYTIEELIGKNPRILKSGITTNDDYKKLWKTIKGGETWQGIFSNVKKNGEIYSESALITPLKNSNGETYAFLAVKEDITEKLNAQRELALSEKRWKLAFESANDGVWDWNIQTNQLILSDNWFNTLGYSNQDIESIQFIWRNVLHPSDFRHAISAVNKHIKGRSNIYSDIHRMKTKEGTYKWFQDRGKIISYNSNGEPERMIGAHFEITKRIELQHELLKMNKDKDQFMSILAHDLRSPFNGLLGFMSIIIEDMESYKPNELRKMLVVVNETATNIYTLLEDILTWSRTQSGKIIFEPTKGNLNSLLSQVYALLQPVASKKNIEISIECNKQNEFFADFNMMKTIIRNLLSNAIKFTNRDGKIKMKVEDKTTKFLFSIADNGTGMNKNSLSKIWDTSTPYTTNGTEKEQGSGLGLLLCKEMVEKHNGEIWVESELGIGSTFFFTIPKK